PYTKLFRRGRRRGGGSVLRDVGGIPLHVGGRQPPPDGAGEDGDRQRARRPRDRAAGAGDRGHGPERDGRDRLMERHEIPTHLEVAGRAFLGLTMRQLLSAAIGLAIAYGALADLPLPLGLRLVLVVVVIVATAVLVLWRPGGRPAEEWAFVLLRYSAAP